MPERDLAPGVGLLEFLIGMAGVFPVAVLEALIARMEGGR